MSEPASEQPEAHGPHHVVQAPDGRAIAFEVRGRGEPLLCHPGGPGFAAHHLLSLGGLDGERLLVLVHPRGTGGSDEPADGDYSIAAHASDLEVVRAALGVERADAFGHSYGAFVVARWASANTASAGRVVLDGAPLRPAEIRHPEAGIEAFFSHYDEVAQRYLATFLHLPFEPPQRYFLEREFASLDLTEDLRAIRSPVLAIVGADDFATGAGMAERVASLCGDGSVAVIPDAGHFAWVEQPGPYRAALRTFLEG